MNDEHGGWQDSAAAASSRTTKMHDIGLRRPRLAELIDARRVVVAHGPAGCGKTTFLRQHAADWHGGVTWLECDGLDRTATAFAGRISRRLGGESDVDLDRAVEGLADELVVIDEVDRLPASDATSVLDALVARLPSSCSVAVGTRRLDVLPNLERWRVAGELACVSGHDLRFRLWETERLFREVYQVPLAVEEVHRVSSASGGWPVALHYFSVSLRQVPVVDRVALIGHLGRNNVRLRRYLRTQVLASLPVSQRAALRRLAVLDRVNLERVELLAPELAHELLSLVSIGVFDDNQADGTFRMHSLLRTELLQELAAEQSEAHVRDLYLEAARVLERIGDSHEACLARARAGHVLGADQPADAVALHAAATRAIDAGDLTSARAQLRSAVAMFAGDGGSVHADRQLRLVNDWVASSPGAPTSWVAAVRMTLEGRRPTWTGEHVEIVDAVRLFVAGDTEGASKRFLEAARAASNSVVAQIAGLCAGSLALVGGRSAEAAGLGHHVWSQCRDDGAEALALVSEALILAHSGSADDIATITKLAESREDLLLRSVMHLVAAYGVRVEPSATSTRLERAAALARQGGFVALARRLSGLSGAGRRSPAVPPPDQQSSDAVRVTCIGGFDVEIDGRLADVGALRPRHREVLAMLTSRPSVPVHREEIAAMIWPERDADSARHGLHTAVSAIRSWLESEGDPIGRSRVERSGDAYLLQLDPLNTDLGRLLDRLRAARRQVSECSIDVVRSLVDEFHDEPFRTFGPADWAVNVRRATAAAMTDFLHAATPAVDADAEAWHVLHERVLSVT